VGDILLIRRLHRTAASRAVIHYTIFR
jgi:hypothetical protein